MTASSDSPARGLKVQKRLSPATRPNQLPELGCAAPAVNEHVLEHGFDIDIAYPSLIEDLQTPRSLGQSPSAPADTNPWFLGPETWEITRIADTNIDAAPSMTTLKNYMATLQSWLVRWVACGSNAFIHALLYKSRSPAYVQVAYATSASYVHRTEASNDLVLRIVEDRARDLLQQNGASPVSLGSEEWTDGAMDENIDVLAQLSRLHALMAYQIIGLLDGDIRARHVAEGRMAVQDSWAYKLLRTAAVTFTDMSAAAAANSAKGSANDLGVELSSKSDVHRQWQVWILSESVRRTCLVAASISPIYTALQQQWAACAGGIMYSNRAGLWEAATAAAWERSCKAKGARRLQPFQCQHLFEEADPADIDEFGMTMLDITFDAEVIERWKYGSSVILS